MSKVMYSYLEAWKSIWKYRWPIIFLYCANVLFTYIITAPYTSYFRAKMQHSDVLDEFSGFDISMILEFLNNYGVGLETFGVLFLIGFVFYFMFGVYSNSAILYSVMSKNEYIAMRPFWNGGLNYFWRIFRLSIYYLIAIIAFLGLAWLTLTAIGIHVLDVKNDEELMIKVRVALIAMGIIVIVLSILKQYAKIFIATRNQPFITGALSDSGSFVTRHFISTLALYLVNLFVLALVFFIYVNVRKLLDVNLWMVTFILAQLLLLFKICFRIVHLHSSFELFSKLQSS